MTTDRYFGRKAICEFAQLSVASLFPTEKSSTGKISEPQVAEWFAYLLYRTAIPDSYVFLALHILRRVSQSHVLDPNAPAPTYFHHSLLLSSTVLATKYMMDDAFSNGSFSIASRKLFTIQQVNSMEMSLLASLNWRIREEGEDLGYVLECYQKEWDGKLETENLEKIKVKKNKFFVSKKVPIASGITEQVKGIIIDKTPSNQWVSFAT